MSTTEVDVLEAFGVDDELDLSSDSTIEAKRADFEIVDVEIQERDNGTQAVVTFSGESLPYPISERFWMKHTNEQAERIGRGQLKRLFRAVLGQPKGSLSNLIGRRVNAYQKEDDSGFARLSSFKAAAATEDTGAVEL